MIGVLKASGPHQPCPLLKGAELSSRKIKSYSVKATKESDHNL
ncbi:MAG: hypothetical protein K0Q95_1057 [Bacteroidota bacterium]|jgi:hypothetical protein|nr:hypothetical protein [Bacteroidota bacterium]